MAQKIKTSQTRQRTVLPMVGNSVDESGDSVLSKIDIELAKLFEDRNAILTDGGTINFSGTSVTFTDALKLTLNSKIDGSVQSFDLGSTSRSFSASGRMLYAVLNRANGTVSVTADAAALPTVVAANQEVFLIAKRSDTPGGLSRLYFRNGTCIDVGIPTRLGSSGSGSGSGGINYILTPSADTGITGWSAYADAAGLSPVDGSGGSPTVTIPATASPPTRATASFLYTKPASNVQGQGFSYDFTIDNADTGKVLQGSFEYQIASGTFADNDLSVWIYDITNARLIQPAPYLLKNSSLIEKFPFEFQTAINSTSYRLIVHQGSTSAIASTIKFDNFNVGPQAKLYGSPILDEKPYTAVLTNLGNATQSLNYSVVGNKAIINGRITIGTTLPTGTIAVGLPPGLSAPTTTGFKGTATANVSTAPYFPIGTAYLSTTTAISILTVGTVGSWNATAPVTWIAGNYFDLVNVEVPIQGWSSSQIMSSDANTRIIASSVAGSGDVVANAAIVQLVGTPTVQYNGAGIYDPATGKVTVRTPGYYRFTGLSQASVIYANSSSTTVLSLYKNNASLTALDFFQSPAAATYNNQPLTASRTVYAVAGDVFDLRFQNNSGNSTTVSSYIFQAEMLSGPSQIMASESVCALYTGAPPTSATLTTTPTLVTFGTKSTDSHNAYALGGYTIPSSGNFDISTQVLIQGSSLPGPNIQASIYIYVNGVERFRNIAFGATTDAGLMPTLNPKSVPLLAGQKVEIYASISGITGPVFSSGGSLSFFSLSKSGNY